MTHGMRSNPSRQPMVLGSGGIPANNELRNVPLSFTPPLVSSTVKMLLTVVPDAGPETKAAPVDVGSVYVWLPAVAAA